MRFLLLNVIEKCIDGLHGDVTNWLRAQPRGRKKRRALCCMLVAVSVSQNAKEFLRGK